MGTKKSLTQETQAVDIPIPREFVRKITEANKEAITAEYGRSCKVETSVYGSALHLLQHLEKCMSKILRLLVLFEHFSTHSESMLAQ